MTIRKVLKTREDIVQPNAPMPSRGASNVLQKGIKAFKTGIPVVGAITSVLGIVEKIIPRMYASHKILPLNCLQRAPFNWETALQCFEAFSKTLNATKYIPFFAPLCSEPYDRYALIPTSEINQPFSLDTFNANYNLKLVEEFSLPDSSTCTGMARACLKEMDVFTVTTLTNEKILSLLPPVAVGALVDIALDKAGLNGSFLNDAARVALSTGAATGTAVVTGTVAMEAALGFTLYKGIQLSYKKAFSFFFKRY